MSERTLYLSIAGVGVVGVIVVLLFLFGVFDRTSSVPQQAETSVSQDVATPEETALLENIDRRNGPEGSTFDTSNKDEFAAAIDAAPGTQEQESLLLVEAKELAQFFVERFGTYSSDTRSTYARDLRGYMTSEMWDAIGSFTESNAPSDSSFSIETQAGDVSVVDFSLPNRRAELTVTALRSEQFSSKSEEYLQYVTVVLKQTQEGSWLVDSILWGDRLN